MRIALAVRTSACTRLDRPHERTGLPDQTSSGAPLDTRAIDRRRLFLSFRSARNSFHPTWTDDVASSWSRRPVFFPIWTSEGRSIGARARTI